MLAAISANNIRLVFFARDRWMIGQSLQSFINVEGVVGACAFDADGVLIYQDSAPGWDLSTVCSQDKPLPAELRNQLNISTQVLHFENKDTIDFWSPVLNKPEQFSEEMLFFEGRDTPQPDVLQRIGFIRVSFDKYPIQQAIRQILGKYILFLLFFLCVIGFVSYTIVRGATKPLTRLIAAIQPEEAATDIKDDMGMLSDTFNGMVDTLSKSFATISELKQGLEKKVQELEAEIERRRKSESSLRQSEEKFRNISEGIADGVAVIIHNKFAWCNNAFCTIFGCRVADLPVTDANKLLPELSDILKSISGTKGHPRYLVESGRFNGRIKSVEIGVQKISFENRDAIQVIARDVTELEKVEKKRKVLEVKALGQSKLASLGKIATSVAHEINQPLSYIKIAYESILRDMENKMMDPAETREYCTESLRQVERITAITDHLRSFSRTDTSVFSTIQVPDVLAHSLILMRESLRLGNITLLQEIDKDLPPVNGNSIKFEQVLINLLQNSIDAMADRAEKKILITMRRVGTMVEICFADTGAGIPPEVLDHIFEPFFTTKRLEDRTGLGLGIVNSIIKEHHGTIEYRQREGWGANFVIMLPSSKEQSPG